MTTSALVAVGAVTLSGQGATPSAAAAESWFTPQNMITAGMLIYGIGMTVQQFRSVAERLATVERELKEFREHTVPDTYVRQDVLEERERLGRRATDPVVRSADRP